VVLTEVSFAAVDFSVDENIDVERASVIFSVRFVAAVSGCETVFVDSAETVVPLIPVVSETATGKEIFEAAKPSAAITATAEMIYINLFFIVKYFTLNLIIIQNVFYNILYNNSMIILLQIYNNLLHFSSKKQ
jgi:hypothetical protein